MSGQTQLNDTETPSMVDIVLDLTSKQMNQWGDTSSMMTWVCPGFRYLWYRLLNNNNGKYVAVPTREVPYAATDGKNIMINPDSFFEFNLPERVFVVAHEIVHNMFGDVELLHRCVISGVVPMHDGTSLPFDNSTMQKAMDLRINALLKESRIERPPKGGHYDDKIIGDMSVIEVYQQENKKKPKDDGDGGNGQDGDNPGGFDNLLPPGKSTGQNPQQAAMQRSQQQWAVEVAAAQTIEQIRSQGKMAGALKRLFQQVLEPEIDWTEQIKAIIARKVGSGSYNWRRGDRRFIGRDIFLPSQSGFGAGWIIIWGDTSGSRDMAEIESNLAELSGIISDVHPKRLTVIWCDAAISEVDEVEDAVDLQRIKARG